MTDQHLILTPEKAVVTFRPAGVGARVSGHLVDLVVAITLVSVLSTAIGFAAPVIGDEAVGAVTTFVGLASVLLYFALFEGLWRGQTPGKKVAGTRVLMVDGTPVTFAAALYRNLLRLADFLPSLYLLGIIVIFTNPRSQRLGDLGAGTIVVLEPRLEPTFTPAPHRAGVHPLEHTVGNLDRMTLAEYNAIKRLCDRFPALPPDTQAQSVREIWAPFAERNGIAPLAGVHPIYQMEAVVMKFGRTHNLV